MNKREFINSIREEYTGIKDMPRESLLGSLKTLADDLYKKDFHFILELIQNAEDNSYDVGVIPHLELMIIEINDLNSLQVVNNEIGFNEENVKAICQVHKSTKDKKLGYIGEKGIGFKSVFKISDNPKIISNGFQFELPKDDKGTKLGYIVPKWIENIDSIIDPKYTNIILPLKDDVDSNDLLDGLHSIKLETILFLKKLKSLVVRDNGELLEIKKESNEKYLTTISTKDNTHKFWLYNKKIIVPKDIDHKGKREGIDDRELSIAIPLDNDIKGQLFSFIPVEENTGLPFIINSDFILVSSRESIHEDLEWNIWLRNNISTTYVEAFISLISDDKLDEQYKISAYNSIPLKSNTSFLVSCVTEIVTKLKESKSILNWDGNTTQPQHSYYFSKELQFFREILFKTKDILPSFFNDKNIVHSKIDKFVNRLKRLGVQEFNVESIYMCLEDKDWLETLSDEVINEIYSFLGKKWDEYSGETYNDYRKIDFILCQDGEFRLPTECFFHGDKKLNEIDERFPRVKWETYTELTKVQPVNKKKRPKEECVVTESAESFLRKIGVREVGEKEEIEKILEEHYSTPEVSRNNDDYNDDLQKFYEYWKRTGDSLNLNSFYTFKNDDHYWKKPTELFLSENRIEKIYYWWFTNTIDFDEMSSVKDTIDIDFLLKTGVKSTIELKVILDKTPVKNHPEWSILSSSGGERNISIVSEDWSLSQTIIDGIEDNILECSLLLLHLLDQCNYSMGFSAEYSKSDKYRDNTTDGSWIFQLQKYSWIPLLDGSFVTPDKATIETLHPEFSVEFNHYSTWVKKVGFGKNEEKRKQNEAQNNQQSYEEVLKNENTALKEKLASYEEKNSKPEFSGKAPKKPKRLEEKTKENYSKADTKSYGKITRQVRQTSTEFKEEFLEGEYLTEDDQLICQLCQNEMPNKKKNGDYSYKKVELFSKKFIEQQNILKNEYESQYIALCPICATDYKNWVKDTVEFLEYIKLEKKPTENTFKVELPIKVDNNDKTLLFTGRHFFELQTILDIDTQGDQ